MKLFISDLDGTLYRHEGYNSYGINDINKQAVLNWIDAGNIFAVATARGISEYDRICNRLGLKISFIGVNGAQMIYEEGKQEIKRLSMKYYIDMCHYARKNNLDITIRTGYQKKWICSYTDCYPFYDDPEKLPNAASVYPVSELNENSEIDMVEIVVPPSLIDSLKKELLKIYEGEVEVVAADFNKLNLSPLNCAKGKSVYKLMEYYGLKEDDIIVIGDSENDISMMKTTRNSYCMSHAKEEVKKESKYIVENVAEAIEIELKKNAGNQ